jgi:hypothetical protein
LRPKKNSAMSNCADLAVIESDPLCLSQHLLHLYATAIDFTYICKLSCILHAASNAHEHTYVCSIYQSGTVEAWYPIYVPLNILNWFDLAYSTFDHQSSVRTLDLILNNKTLYMCVPHSGHDYMNFTYLQL